MASRQRRHSRLSVAYLSVVEFSRSPGIMTDGGLKAARRASVDDTKVQRDRQELEQALIRICERSQMPQISEKNQLHSTFLSRLPAELREVVYEHYYEGLVLTISEVFLHRKLTYAAFANQAGATSSSSESYGFRSGRRARNGLLDLPRTCRQIYLEAIGYMYKNNTFRFDSAASLFALDRIFLPRRLEVITSLEIELRAENLLAYQGLLHNNPPKYAKGRRELWIRLWSLLATLPRLQRVRVKLNRSRPDDMREEKYETIFEPMLEFSRDLAEFEVEVTWTPEDVTRFEDAPFKFVCGTGESG